MELEKSIMIHSMDEWFSGHADTWLQPKYKRAVAERLSKLRTDLTEQEGIPALVLAFGGWRPGFTGLWSLTFLFNAGGILYARMCREAIVEGIDSAALPGRVRQLASFVLSSFVLVAIQLASGRIGWTGALSLIPLWMLLRAGIKNPMIHASMPSLGFTLLGQAVVFALWLGLAS